MLSTPRKAVKQQSVSH